MKLHELQATAGSRSEHYRKGRGIGSGNGKTAGKGHRLRKMRIIRQKSRICSFFDCFCPHIDG